METVYLETSFISYLVARPSRDVVVAGHQQTTQEWWANRRSLFECSVSQVVIDEASANFLVRFSNIVDTEKEIASIAMHEGINPSVKDFAATLYRELYGIKDSIASFQVQKNIVLPSVIPEEEQ